WPGSGREVVLRAKLEEPMAKARMKRELEVPADVLWRLVASFGDTSWMPAGTRATVVGAGPGMERRIAAGPDRVITERLESLDEASRTPTHTIPQNVPVPGKDYREALRARA